MSGYKPPPVMIDPVILSGGLDQITPTLSLPNGYAKNALNFECGVSGGYSRILGYERFDGHTSPSSPAAWQVVTVATVTTIPVIGQVLTASGGATGTIAYVDGATMAVCIITGTFAVAETVSTPSGLVGTVSSVAGGPETPLQKALMENAIADIYRGSISAVPGTGTIRGVVEYNDTVYAFRDDAAGTALDIYKSTTAGWSKVALNYTVSFTAGTKKPAEGSTLTKGGVTATILRVATETAYDLSTGEWTAGSATGKMIISAPSGGNFSAGTATVAGGTTLTLSGAQTAITLLTGGKFEFEETNFGGQATTRRLYGCDGVNPAFEFDGTILVKLYTGADINTPTHVAAHRNYLFLSIGSSIMYSVPGYPYDYRALGGAGEIATGDTVTGMIVMPGGTGTSTLGVFSRNNTSILYGTSVDDWNFVQYNTGTGAMPFSVRNMAQTLAFDDRGAISIQAALQYGNFDQSTLTNQVLPFINYRPNSLTCASLNRRKSQYRLFFSDGYGLYITIVNGKLLGCMPTFFPDVVSCVYEGKTSTGEDINYFGSDNGMVYQLDKGTSFDGENIPYQLQLNYTNAKGPRTQKRYRKAAIEVVSSSAAYAEFKFGYSLGYLSPEYEQAVSKDYASYLGSSQWDVFIWDLFFWDTNSIGPIECPLDGTAENLAISFAGEADYVQAFTVNSILIHYTPRRMMR